MVLFKFALVAAELNYGNLYQGCGVERFKIRLRLLEFLECRLRTRIQFLEFQEFRLRSDSLHQGCPTFCSSRAKCMSVGLSRTAIVKLIKVMLLCVCFTIFVSKAMSFLKKKVFTMVVDFILSLNWCFSKAFSAHNSRATQIEEV